MEEIKLNIENLSKEEREQLMKLVEKANKPKVGRWKPNHGDIYWYITAFVAFGVSCRKYEGYKDDENNLLLGNVFKTKEEAEFALEKRKVEVELQDIAKELNGDWIPNIEDEDQMKYNLRYNACTKNIEVEVHNTFIHRDIYFKCESKARAALIRIGEKRLKKYYFEVE